MTNTEFKKLVGNRIFGVTFIKKDGTPRTYKSCRVGVRCDTSGGDNPVEHKENLVTVWTIEDKTRKYRTLNLETLISLRANGSEYLK